MSLIVRPGGDGGVVRGIAACRKTVTTGRVAVRYRNSPPPLRAGVGGPEAAETAGPCPALVFPAVPITEIDRRRIACALLGLGGLLAWRAADRPMWPVVERVADRTFPADAELGGIPPSGPIGAPLAQLPLPPRDAAPRGVRLAVEPLPATLSPDRLPSAAITYVEAAPSTEAATGARSISALQTGRSSGWSSEGVVLPVGYEATLSVPGWQSGASPIAPATFDSLPTRER